MLTNINYRIFYTSVEARFNENNNNFFIVITNPKKKIHIAKLYMDHTGEFSKCNNFRSKFKFVRRVAKQYIKEYKAVKGDLLSEN